MKTESEDYPLLDLSQTKYPEFMPTKVWLFMDEYKNPHFEGNGKNPKHPFAYMGGWPANHKLEYIRADHCKPTIKPMTEAPRRGQPVLLKFKDDLTPYFGKEYDHNTFHKQGKYAVCFNDFEIKHPNPSDFDKHCFDNWRLDGPYGQGGFPDLWFDGFMFIEGVDYATKD